MWTVFKGDEMSKIDELLSRLHKVRKTGQGKWTACCPAHNDKDPSLGVTETPDGTILLKCWTGCSAAAIVDSIGLNLSDLFPERTDKYFVKGNPKWLDANQRLTTLAKDALLVTVCAAKLRGGEKLTPEDMTALVNASGRCNALAEDYL